MLPDSTSVHKRTFSTLKCVKTLQDKKDLTIAISNNN